MTLPTETIRKQQRRRRRQDRGQRHQSQQGLERIVQKFAKKSSSLALSNGRQHLSVTPLPTDSTTILINTLLIITLLISLISAKLHVRFIFTVKKSSHLCLRSVKSNVIISNVTCIKNCKYCDYK